MGPRRLAAEGSGTKVTWTIDGDMGTNPLMRWFALGADGLIGKDFAEVNLGMIEKFIEAGKLDASAVIDHAALQAAGGVTVSALPLATATGQVTPDRSVSRSPPTNRRTAWV